MHIFVLFSFQLFCSIKQADSSSVRVTYPVRVVTQESQYPTDAVDALMMTLKETAPSCNLDCFVEVGHLVYFSFCI